jgi:hypothetical protein
VKRFGKFRDGPFPSLVAACTKIFLLVARGAFHSREPRDCQEKNAQKKEKIRPGKRASVHKPVESFRQGPVAYDETKLIHSCG